MPSCRCRTWLKNAGRFDLLQMPLHVVQKNYHLCEQHFEIKWFRQPEWKASLDYSINPIPTIFVNNRKSFPSEVVKEEYEAKKKREEFMRTFCEYDEMSLSDEELEENEKDDELQDVTHEALYNEDELKGTSSVYEETSVTDEVVRDNEIDNQLDNNEINEDLEENEINNYLEDNEIHNELEEIEIHNELEENEIQDDIEDVTKRIITNEIERKEEACIYKGQKSPNACRFCTLPAGKNGKHFFSDDDESKKLQEMVNFILPAQVYENDGLPHHICVVCIDKLKQCYDTIIAFFAAEAFFRRQDCNEVLEENDDISDCTIKIDSLPIQEENSSQIDSCNLMNDLSNTIENVEEITNVQNNNKKSNAPLICGLCFMKFSSLQDLRLHRKFKHPPNTFVKKRFYCVKCPMIFMKGKTLQSHIKSTHPPELKDYPCEDCDMVFKLKHMLNTHRKQMHKKHICHICKEAFYYPVLLKRHMNLHDNDTKCSICQKEFKNAHWRRVHEKSHSVEGCHLCWICGKVFHLKTSLNSHLQTHCNTYKCEVCGKSIATLSGYKKHQVLHKERVKNYKCSKCEKAFYSNQLLKQHYLSHTGIRPHICHCGAAFNRLSNLNYHKKRHVEGYKKKSKRILNAEADKDVEIYTCELCNKELISRLTYKYHLSRHTGNKKPFDCEECGLAFSTAYSYKTHVRIHTGERPFVCPVKGCGLGFRSKSTLQQHEIVHVEDRPFVCPYCPDTFKRLYSLNMHKTTHSALRPYQCNICERAFARKPDARIHVMRQHSVPSAEVYEYLQEVIGNEIKHSEDINFPYIIEEEILESDVTNEIVESKPDIGSSEESSIVYNIIMS